MRLLRRVKPAMRTLGVALLMVAMMPSVAFAECPVKWPSEDIPGPWYARTVAGIINYIVAFLEWLGARPICELVFNQGNNAQSLVWGVFTQNEFAAISKLFIFFFAASTTVLVFVVAMFAGLKIMRSAHDSRGRAMGMYIIQDVFVAMLLTAVSGPLMWGLFDLNSLLVEVFAEWSPAHDVTQMFMGRGLEVIPAALARLTGVLVSLQLNVVYIMRKFALMILVAFAPVATFMWVFDSTRAVTKVWVQELVANVILQPVHALLFALFFYAYGTEALEGTSNPNAFAAIAFMLVLQPLTNLLISVVTGGRTSNFTGMGAAAFMAGLGTFLALGQTAFGSKAAGAAAGAAAGVVAGAGPGGPPGGGGGGGGGINAGADAAGHSGTRGRVGARTLGPTLNSRLGRTQQWVQRARNVGRVVGRTTGATLGAGLALATGNPHAVAIGASFGESAGAVAGGTTAVTASMAAQGTVEGLKGGVRVGGEMFRRSANFAYRTFDHSSDWAKAGHALLSVGYLVGGTIGGGAAGLAWNTLRSGTSMFWRDNNANWTGTEKAEAAVYNVLNTVGHAVGGERGAEMGNFLGYQFSRGWRTVTRQFQLGDQLHGRLERGELKEGQIIKQVHEPNRVMNYIQNLDEKTRDQRPWEYIGVAPADNPNIPLGQSVERYFQVKNGQLVEYTPPKSSADTGDGSAADAGQSKTETKFHRSAATGRPLRNTG